MILTLKLYFQEFLLAHNCCESEILSFNLYYVIL